MNAALDPHKDRLLNDLRVVVADAEALLQAGAGEIGSGTHHAREQLIARLQETRDRMGRMQETLLARSKAAGRAADVYVHENPWKAIGAAAGAGVLVGLLLGRR
jgi:ElaB/YqjD/DUF883 family membrane-anchored ribosome-binding protein